MTKKYGDEEFKEFLDDETNEPNEALEEASFVTYTLKLKINNISKMYTDTLKYYSILLDCDPLKKELEDFIKVCITEAKQTFTQFDYALIQDDGDDDDDEEELNEQQT